MSLNFYQGQNDLLKELHDKDTAQQLTFIQNRLEDFFKVKNLSFLFGSGTSCNAIPNMADLFKGLKSELKGKDELECLFNECIKAKGENLENILGLLYSGKSYYATKKNRREKLEILIAYIEKFIFNKIHVDFNNPEALQVFETYKCFYQKMAFRSKDLSRINIFTTNNDLFNEKAMDYLNIHYIDGFFGGLEKYFNPAMFNYSYSKRMDTGIDKFEPVENFVYLYKLHGSINWVEDDRASNTYFNIVQKPEPLDYKEKPVLVYPTPLKQNMSIGSPYVDILREYQHKLLQPNSSLIVIGYSFSDEHINDIIYRALATNSSINLIILNDVEKKSISKIDDDRIFRLWETKDEEEDDDLVPIHYFYRIVNDLLPNLDSLRDENALEKFIQQLNEVKSNDNTNDELAEDKL